MEIDNYMRIIPTNIFQLFFYYRNFIRNCQKFYYFFLWYKKRFF